MVKSFKLKPTVTINSDKSKWLLVVFDYNNFDYYNHVISLLLFKDVEFRLLWPFYPSLFYINE